MDGLEDIALRLVDVLWIIWLNFQKGWKKSLLQVIVVVEVHKQLVVVRHLSLEALSHPTALLLPLLTRYLSNMAQEIITSLTQSGHMHPELGWVLGGKGGSEVARGHDVFYFRMLLGKVGNKVHLFPAILFFAGYPREPKAFKGLTLHEVEGSI